jgi:hypothetical protein
MGAAGGISPIKLPQGGLSTNETHMSSYSPVKARHQNFRLTKQNEIFMPQANHEIQ